MKPFAFQHYAKDFYDAYIRMKGGPRFSPARLFLIARSLELAAKSLHLANGRTTRHIEAVRHNLLAACDPEVLAEFGIEMTDDERTELERANGYYEGKGFEYFIFDHPEVDREGTGPAMALTGWPGLPWEPILEGLLLRLLAPRLE